MLTGPLGRGVRRSLCAALLVAAVTACSDDEPDDEAEPTPTALLSPTDSPAPPVTPTPTTSATESATESEPPDPTALDDGRHPAYITGVDDDAATITIDVVQWFVGEAAAEAAEEDGSPEVPPPNDYWIRNENPLLRTLPVSAGAVITVNTLTAGQTGDATENVEVDLTRLGGFKGLRHHLFWVTVDDGVVVQVREQYLP